MLYIIALSIFLFGLCFHLSTKKYLNPYKLIMIFGKKGSGKTTLLTKLSLRYKDRGWTVFCTDHIPGSYKIDYDDIGKVWFPEHSVLLVDEVGMIWDNRNFKNFKTEVRDWFKFQRHNKVRVYLFSQSFDIDKKLRDLTDEMYLVTNKLRVFSYGRKIDKIITIRNGTAEAPSTLAEDYQFESFLFFPFGSRMLTFIPKYAKYFDSHTRLDIPDLQLDQCYYNDIPKWVKRKTKHKISLKKKR